MKKFLLAVALIAIFPMVSFGALTILPVTKDTQEETGLVFTLTAVRDPSNIIFVTLKVPRKGKLAYLRSIDLTLREGNRHILIAPLRTEDVEDRVAGVHFRIEAELAEKSTILLHLGQKPGERPSLGGTAYGVKLGVQTH